MPNGARTATYFVVPRLGRKARNALKAASPTRARQQPGASLSGKETGGAKKAFTLQSKAQLLM